MADRIVMNQGSLPIKKQFLTRVFFPYGKVVCGAIGIVPASEEVSDEEAHQAYHEVTAAAASWGEFVLERARWYVQGHDALMESGEAVPERDLVDHLTAFALSLMVDERLA